MKDKIHDIILIVCVILIVATIMTVIIYVSIQNQGKNRDDETATQYAVSDDIPALTKVTDDENNDFDYSSRYSYLIDRRTGVVYIEYTSGRYRYGITAMLNPDGSAVTADQLGFEYEPYK